MAFSGPLPKQQMYYHQRENKMHKQRALPGPVGLSVFISFTHIQTWAHTHTDRSKHADYNPPGSDDSSTDCHAREDEDTQELFWEPQPAVLTRPRSGSLLWVRYPWVVPPGSSPPCQVCSCVSGILLHLSDLYELVIKARYLQLSVM